MQLSGLTFEEMSKNLFASFFRITAKNLCFQTLTLASETSSNKNLYYVITQNKFLHCYKVIIVVWTWTLQVYENLFTDSVRILGDVQ